MTSFAIIKFCDENENVEVIPSSWLTSNKTECYFPEKITRDDLDKLVSKKAPPDLKWHTFSVKIFCETDDLGKANNYCLKAEETSNIETTDVDDLIDRRYPHRKHKRKEDLDFIFGDITSESDKNRTNQPAAPVVPTPFTSMPAKEIFTEKFSTLPYKESTRKPSIINSTSKNRGAMSIVRSDGARRMGKLQHKEIPCKSNTSQPNSKFARPNYIMSCSIGKPTIHNTSKSNQGYSNSIKENIKPKHYLKRKMPGDSVTFEEPRNGSKLPHNRSVLAQIHETPSEESFSMPIGRDSQLTKKRPDLSQISSFLEDCNISGNDLQLPWSSLKKNQEQPLGTFQEGSHKEFNGNAYFVQQLLSQITAVEEKFVTYNEEHKLAYKEIDRKLKNVLTLLQNDGKGNEEDLFDGNSDIVLPLNTVDGINLLEDKISRSNVMAVALCRRLSGSGSFISTRLCIFGIMRELMTNQLARKFNLTGKPRKNLEGNKLSFQSLKTLFEVVIRAALKYFPREKKACKEAIGLWLKYAKQRKDSPGEDSESQWKDSGMEHMDEEQSEISYFGDEEDIQDDMEHI